MNYEFNTANPLSLNLAYEKLLAGGVIIFPTETVYGIGVLAGDVAAENRLRKIKGRDGEKPFQRLVADLDGARKLVQLSPLAENVLQIFFPGALTVVLPSLDGKTTYGVRAPAHEWLQKLLRKLPQAMIATSANFAEMPPATNAETAHKILGRKVDLIIDGGVCVGGNSSTVISLINDELKMLRVGEISEKEIMNCMGGHGSVRAE